MQELRLEPGLQPREVRKAVKPPYKAKYRDEPGYSTITRAYRDYESKI